ncbi:MAG: glycosyl transferase GT17 family protein [Eubacteriales bacterium]|nr:glycosyl transferase GT17 family protein [Eubacteriales bacterium]
MVYDCFQFFNELDILKLRMHVLNDIVDKFVISEATVTFSGDKKPLYFQENQEMFAEFKDKIIHRVVDDTPMDVSAFLRDSHQKCAVARGLAGAKDEDIVIFSDVDEIPNPEAVKKVLADFDPGKIYALAQRNFYCYLDMEETSGSLLSITGEFPGIEGRDRRWLGTKICSYGMLKKYTTEQLRDKAQQPLMVRVPEGGWHFSYMGGGKNESVEDRVKYKIRSAAHQEYNNRATLSKVKKKIRNHEDILGRSTDFQIVPVDDSFPAYLREHLEEYRYLMYPEKKGLLERLLGR